MATDAIEIGAGEGWCEPHVAPDDVALLQYTSGSTAEPRGVMVSHRNALHNSAAIHRLAQHDERSVYVCWLPSYHDMGLIGGILQPIYGGLLGVLMSPASFLQSPVRWLRALSRFGGTTTPFPNFALDHCVRRISAAERDEVDLSALRVACNGAEPVRWETLQRFARTFSPRGFHPEAHYPAYGLAEATLLVSGRSPSDSLQALRVDRAALAAGRVEGGEVLTLNGTDEASTGAAKWAALVSCGRSLPDQELLIVEPEARCPVGPDCVGEIWVRGPSIAQGYFRRPAETAETFGARLADGSGPFLRTGDLGFLRDGELYVTGRRKDLIILRGRNMYPQDIERTAERCHRQLRPGGVAAFAIEGEGEERLALAAEVDARSGPPDWDGIWVALQEAVAREHDVALSVATLLSSGTLPKTSSGKVQRRACREALVRGELTVLRRFSVSVPAAVTPTSESAIAHTGADCTSLYDALHARVARLDRRSTRYRYDLERDVPWHRLDEAGLYAGPSLLASERIDLSSVANTQAADLLQWTLAVNICDRFIALEEAVLRFTAEERAALGGTRSIELLDAEEEKHIAMFRRYGEHLRRLRPELAPDADRYLAAARERLAETFRRLTTPLERHYANWVLIVFFEEYSLFMYRELLRDAPALQPVWLAIHRAHAREEAQHVQTDAAYLAALRVSEEQRYAWSRGIFDALAADFSVLFALLGE
ncbi:MAG TPA: AMP-binding protein, partial [Polyangiaceae bacterium]|nr:AMP-binding protein [Polyangiaceae bacterium]